MDLINDTDTRTEIDSVVKYVIGRNNAIEGNIKQQFAMDPSYLEDNKLVVEQMFKVSMNLRKAIQRLYTEQNDTLKHIGAIFRLMSTYESLNQKLIEQDHGSFT